MATTKQPVAQLFFERVDKFYPRFEANIEHFSDGIETRYTFCYTAQGKETTVRVMQVSNMDGDEENFISPTYDYRVEYDSPTETGVATSYLYNGAKHFKQLNKIFTLLMKNWKVTQSPSK